MPSRFGNAWIVRVITAACFLAVLVMASTSLAAGRVQWTKTKVSEREASGGSWRLEVAIFLPKPPDIAHMPMKFEFEPVSYFERAMLDGDKLVERRVPLTGRQAIIESVEVGFMDPGSGKIQKRTKFSFKITRAHGFEAGEYKVTIRNGRSGGVVGTPTKLTFDGENEIIDRRAMVFAAKDAKKKKKDDAKPAEEGAAGETSAEGEDPTASEEPIAEETPAEPAAAVEDPPQEIQEKPGGCGCRVEALPGSSSWPLTALAALGLALLVRRRRAA